MSQLIKVIALINLVYVLSFKVCVGQSALKNEIGFRNDNDVYLMIQQDQYYTNGLYVYFNRAARSFSDRWVHKTWQVGAGHNIYNASDGYIIDPREIDRSITGYMYMNGSMNWFTANESVLTLGVEVGAIGSKSRGEEVQSLFHKAFGFYQIDGWEYQLNDAIGVDLRGRYKKMLVRSKSNKSDIILNGDFSIGLNHSRVALGPTFRLGDINPLYESVATGSRIQSQRKEVKREFYFFYTPMLNWVVYNSTIEGGMLVDYKGPVSFDIEPLVFSNVFGIQWAKKNVGLHLIYTFQTKEVKSNATAHQYGSLGFNYRF